MISIKSKSGSVLLTVANTTGLDLSKADLRSAHLPNAEMEGFYLVEADLEGADLSGADLYWCIFTRANLRRANLSAALMRGVNLIETDLQYADLTNADLGLDNVGGFSELQGADLRHSTVHGINLAGARYDSMTRFPDGFDPIANAMVKL